MTSKKTHSIDPFLPEETSSNQRDRVIAAVERFSARQAAAKGRPKRKNKKPEEGVVQELLKWYVENKFFIARYESKAKLQGGRYRSSGLAFGTPDLVGVCPNGYHHACEVKAKGRRSTLREAQRNYLLRVIECNGFAIVCDSLDDLKKWYKLWLEIDHPSAKRAYLKKLLPKEKERKAVEF